MATIGLALQARMLAMGLEIAIVSAKKPEEPVVIFIGSFTNSSHGFPTHGKRMKYITDSTLEG